MTSEILRIEHLSAFKGDQHRLEISNFNLLKGEAVFLLGLNDSGLSELIDILCGKIPADHGRILIDEKVVSFPNESTSRLAGIYRISKEQTLVDELKISENFFILRKNSMKNVFLDRKLMVDQARFVLDSLDIQLSPTSMVGKLSAPEKQLVELAKAVSSGAKIIIFDEAFSQYSADDHDCLIKLVKKLKEQGISFIFCCRSTNEIMHFTDRIIFLKDGVISKKIDTAMFTDAMIGDYMVGHTLEIINRGAHATSTALEVANVALQNTNQTLNFSVKHGEVVALLDLEPGERCLVALPSILSGKDRKAGANIKLNGVSILNKRAGEKIITIFDLANKNTLFPNMSVAENLLIPSLKKIKGPLGLVGSDIVKVLKNQSTNILKRDVENVHELSLNENIQILLERWYIFHPEVLILMDPFLNIDEIGCKIIEEYVNKFTQTGVAVIIMATRPHKLDHVCDRIIEIAPTQNAHSESPSPAKEYLHNHAKALKNSWGTLFYDFLKKYEVAILIILVYCLLESHILGVFTVKILLRQTSIVGFAILGAFLTIFFDGYNFSVGALASLTTVFTVFLASILGLPVWFAILITFLISSLLGVFYSMVTSNVKIPVMLFSLGMLYILNGFNSQFQKLTSNVFFNNLINLAYGEIYNIPIALITFVIILLLIHVVLKQTYLGRSIFAIGSNQDESLRSGLPVNQVKIVAYIISFMLINITGIFFLARTSMSSATYGNTYYIDVMVALCIGRISLWGGKGGLIGVLFGAICIILLESFVILSGIGLFYGYILKGSIIVTMVLVDYFSEQKNVREKWSFQARNRSN